MEVIDHCKCHGKSDRKKKFLVQYQWDSPHPPKTPFSKKNVKLQLLKSGKKKQTNKQNKQKESQKKPKTIFETIYLENQYKELGGNDMTIED